MTNPTPHAALLAAAEALRIAESALGRERKDQYGYYRERIAWQCEAISIMSERCERLAMNYQPKEASE